MRKKLKEKGIERQPRMPTERKIFPFNEVASGFNLDSYLTH